MEVADALGADDALGPFAGHELVEESQIEGTAAVVDIGADAVFLGLALIVMVVVMMVMAVLVMFVVMMMMLMIVVVVIVMMVVLVLIVIVIIFAFIVVLLHFLYPFGGGGDVIEVEHIGIQYLVEIHVAIVCVDDFCLWLQFVDDAAHSAQLFGTNLGGLVQQYDVAEFYLLYHQVLNILLVDILTSKVEATAELIPHTECINHCDDTIEAWSTVGSHFGCHHGY